MDLPKDYDGQAIEQKWRKRWQEGGTYRFNRVELTGSSSIGQGLVPRAGRRSHVGGRVTPAIPSGALPRSIRHWSLTTLKEKLVKIGAKVVRHSRYVIFQLAEVAVPRQLFAAILGRIRGLAPAPT